MAKFIIPSPFRKYTDNQREVIVDSTDLGGAMKALVKSYEGMNVLFDHPALLSVFVNGKLVSTGADQWDRMNLENSDEITLIIPIAGG